MKRQKSREKAMELLFSMELSKNTYEETIETFIEDYEMDLKTIDAVSYTHLVIKFYKGDAFSVEAPNFVELLITQADPGVKGNTATNAMKPVSYTHLDVYKRQLLC